MTEAEPPKQESNAHEKKTDNYSSAAHGASSSVSEKEENNDRKSAKSQKRKPWTQDVGIFWLTVLGLIIAAFYVYYTREEVILESKKTRPFVAAESVNLVDVKVRHHLPIWDLRIRWRNTGNMPTERMRLVVHCFGAWAGTPYGDPYVLAKKYGHRQKVSTIIETPTLAPDQTEDADGCYLRPLGVSLNILNFVPIFYVYGSAEYLGASSRRNVYVAKFCFGVRFEGKMGSWYSNPKIPPPQVLFWRCKGGNCVDSGCSQAERQEVARDMIARETPSAPHGATSSVQ